MPQVLEKVCDVENCPKMHAAFVSATFVSKIAENARPVDSHLVDPHKDVRCLSFLPLTQTEVLEKGVDVIETGRQDFRVGNRIRIGNFRGIITNVTREDLEGEWA